MKLLLSLLLFGLSLEAKSLTLLVQDPCTESNWLATTFPLEAKQSVGELTITALTQAQIAYKGSATGIASIRDTVVGDQALEIISDREMRAYGWCYRLNGVVPEALADQVYVTTDQDQIEWFFAYAHYRDGEWRDYCQPTQKTKPAFICKKTP